MKYYSGYSDEQKKIVIRTKLEELGVIFSENRIIAVPEGLPLPIGIDHEKYLIELLSL